MAEIIGRKACPDCGFGAAHIKQTPGKLPYRHCPECGLMTHAKNGAQAQLIKAGMRPVGDAEPPAPSPKPATDIPPASEAAPPAPAVVPGAGAASTKRRSWASTLLG